MVRSDDFMDRLRVLNQQSRRIITSDEEILQEFVGVDEPSFSLAELTPEYEQRGLTYLSVPENLVLNGDFETDLASWTEALDAGVTATTTQSVAQAKKLFGSLGSLRINITNSTATGQQARRQQLIASVVGDVWSLECWALAVTLTSAKLRFIVEFLDAGSVVLATAPIQEITVVGTLFQQLKVENQTAPASTANLRIKLVGESTAASAIADLYFDLVRAEKAQTIISDRGRRIIAGEFKAS